ncbi:MAG TPA: OAM dimerization domain-containing protein [Thermoleophilaceae bacterium]|jgi:beta-lysine 5,6-aminomutase beta subunit
MPDLGEPQPIMPYGSRAEDGMVQLSFTLPLPEGELAHGAALQLAARMGLHPARVVHSQRIGDGFTFFVVYGATEHGADLSLVTCEPAEYPLLAPDAVDRVIRTRLGRELVVVGACIGSDAHTVGLDAILSVKGYAGERGLESYEAIRVVNLGSQVPPELLVQRAADEHADAVLVSQVVTEGSYHLEAVRRLVSAVRAHFENAPRPLLVAGGPRLDGLSARELGVDRVFGRGSTPGAVASYLAHAVVSRSREGVDQHVDVSDRLEAQPLEDRP